MKDDDVIEGREIPAEEQEKIKDKIKEIVFTQEKLAQLNAKQLEIKKKNYEFLEKYSAIITLLIILAPILILTYLFISSK